MLVLTRKSNEAIFIGNNVKVKVLKVERGHVSLGIEAPVNVAVHREEIFNKISDLNRKGTFNMKFPIEKIRKREVEMV